MTNDKPSIYMIPDNFIDESRVLKGMFKTRNFVEAIIYAVLISLPVFALTSGQSLETKLTVLTFCAAPPFLLGITGINGDAVSVAVKNSFKWLKTRGIMLYNDNITLLKRSPIEVRQDEVNLSDKIVDVLDAVKDIQREKAAGRKYERGKTFDFISDNEHAGNEAELLYEVQDSVGFKVKDDTDTSKWTAKEEISIKIPQLNISDDPQNTDDICVQYDTEEIESSGDTEGDEIELDINL